MSGFTRGLILGGAIGVYVGQSYHVPNIKNMIEHGIEQAKEWEQENRKARQKKVQTQNENNDNTRI